MDKITKEKLNIQVGVSTAEFFVRTKAIETVDSISKIHPMIKLYFDSELNSEIEKNTLVSMSEALLRTVEIITEKGSMANYRGIAVVIVQTLSKRMYFAKLIHHANTGRITTEQFYELASGYIAAESVNLIDRLWDFVGEELPQYVNAGIQRLLVSLDVDPQTAEWIAGLIDSFANIAYSYVREYLTKEKIQDFLYYVIKYTLESARKLSLLIDGTVEKTKVITNKVRNWVRNICVRFQLYISDFFQEPRKRIIITNPQNKLIMGKGVLNKPKPSVYLDIDKEDVDIFAPDLEIE